MADADHVAAVVDPEAVSNPDIGNGTETVIGAGPETEISPSRHAGERDGSEPNRELHDSQHAWGGTAPTESDQYVEPSVLQPRARYPLNSKRLTAWHLRALAGALELPTSGSADQLRRCIEAVVAEDHEYQNVVVTVRESPKTEHVVALADADGEFVVSEPVYRDVRHVHFDEEVQSTAEFHAMRQQLDEANQLLKLAAAREGEQLQQIVELQETLHECEVQATETCDSLRQRLAAEKERAQASWRANCEHLAQQDTVITAQDDKIASLRRRISVLENSLSSHQDNSPAPPSRAAPSRPRVLPATKDSVPVSVMPSSHPPQEQTSLPPSAVTAPPVTPSSGLHSSQGVPPGAPNSNPQTLGDSVSESGEITHSNHSSTSTQQRRGRAPPIEFFTGEDPAINVDDWLPSLERASSWNGWSTTEKLMQLPGYLKGRALQEWRLLSRSEQQDYTTAINALRVRLDPGSKTMAAQDFRHSLQKSGENVPDFIRRLEKTFQIAYGKDDLNPTTRDTLLYGQLYEGLTYDVMQSPAVSGAQTYQELCTAAKGEEKRLAALKQRRHLTKATPSPQPTTTPRSSGPKQQQHGTPSTAKGPRVCFKCGNPGHFAMNCTQGEKESKGKGSSGRAKQVQTEKPPRESKVELRVPDFLHSSSDEETPASAKTVRVVDKGSAPQCVRVQVQGVPAYGLIDSGADITIMGGTLFKKVATVTKLKKRDFMKADKVPRTYDQRPFQLDGRMDLDIAFGDHTMKTPVYIKMDAHDQLLLSEGVCRQLEILHYHPSVERWRGGKRKLTQQQTGSSSLETRSGNQSDQSTTTQGDNHEQGATVPMVSVRLLQSTSVLPHQSKVVEVALPNPSNSAGCYFLEPSSSDSGLRVDPSLIRVVPDEPVLAVISNPSGVHLALEEGDLLGEATPVDVVLPHKKESDARPETPEVKKIQSKPPSWRKKQLIESVGVPEALTPAQQQEFLDFLTNHHNVFALEEYERGETSLVEMEIDTGDAHPRRCAPRRVPFAVRAEMAQQIDHMQVAKVIQPSASPWASPVVMVQKKDGTHRFCIDYRQLNAVTKADTYPLPRIDDLLDQLGQCRYFSTLDLASGYWQIRMSPSSREKTAFVTPQGLYEFCVMPFGLTNAPAVFQRLMQRLVTGLNPAAGPDFVAVYIDDILVFSPTLEQHLRHLKVVIERISEAGLKLKPTKCRFARNEVEYLGHLITPEGLKPNSNLVEAVQQFPIPTDVSGVRRFLGLASYYRRFIQNFARIAEPLRELTRKNVSFHWTKACEDAMKELQTKLTTAPVLAYPSFDRPYTVETDASISGLGAVLSQMQSDKNLHPVAYASRSLSAAERNYSVTELETLAVVWALTRFHSYLYGQSVTVITDHLAVRAVLETPNPSCKHARWWNKVYGSGLKEVKVVYRAGRLNSSADALSRSPLHEPGTPVDETHVLGLQSESIATQAQTEDVTEIPALLAQSPVSAPNEDFASEQRKDPELVQLITYLERGELPADDKKARQMVLQKSLFTINNGILIFVDPKQDHRRRVVVPSHLRRQILSEHHSSPMGGHFAAKKTYGALMRHWWWDGMYNETLKFTSNCPQCAVVTGGGRHHRPPLHPIPVSRPFQIVGVDVMELPKTDRGNRYVLVFQDFLTKWPLVFPMPDQKSQRIAELLVNEVIPLFGVPEALLSDRGANLLSHLMYDICDLLGITKLNTTAHHPQCDGMVERFNRTLKSMLRKHAANFGSQWDRYLSGALWAYRNVPHDSTKEKPSFLLLGIDCRTPTEAALLPPHELEPTEVTDYREEMVLSLSTARKLAAEAIKSAQVQYKKTYDKLSREMDYQLGDWVLVKFPQEETGRQRKLSRPWHGPYRIVERNDPDVTVVKVYAPQDGPIQVHQMRVAPCPPELPAGFFWYGSRRSSPGRPPKWVNQLLEGELFSEPEDPAQESAEESVAEPAATDRGADQETSQPHDDGVTDSSATSTGDPVAPFGILSQADTGDGDAALRQASRSPEPRNLSQSAHSPRKHRKYPLRKKRSPPKKLMAINSRTSFFREGADVEQ